MMITILFLASNPSNTDTLHLEEEIRAVDRAIQAAKHRDVIKLEPQLAVRVDDLQEHQSMALTDVN